MEPSVLQEVSGKLGPGAVGPWWEGSGPQCGAFSLLLPSSSDLFVFYKKRVK